MSTYKERKKMVELCIKFHKSSSAEVYFNEGSRQVNILTLYPQENVRSMVQRGMEGIGV